MNPSAATLLLLVFSHSGYWFGGQDNAVTARWAVKADTPPAAELRWELMLGDARLDHGDWRELRPGDDSGLVIHIKPPTVRARTAARWVYRVRAKATAEELGRGEATIDVFPNNLMDGLADRVAAGKAKLVVWDAADAIPKLLQRAKVEHTRIDGVGRLQLGRAGAVLVGEDVLGPSPFVQSPLLEQAKSGATVLVLAQRRAVRVMGYELASRKVDDSGIKWRADHPLLNRFNDHDLASFLSSGAAHALRLPPNEAALEIGYWPSAVKGKSQNVVEPIDAVLVVKRVGAGRIVLCQIPLGDWESDPRSQVFLSNAIDFLLTRPESTPAPSERRREPAATEPRNVPTITIPSGAQP